MDKEVEIIKKVDRQGRLVLPKEWRKKYAGKSVIVRVEGDTIIIRPRSRIDITKYFDRIEVDLSSDLSDWRAVRRELFEVR